MSCRGCGGHGVDIKRSPRDLQIATTPVTLVPTEAKLADHPRTVNRMVTVAANTFEGRAIYRGPLALALARIASLEHNGFRPTVPVPFDKTWACEWCNGTGSPQLSVHTIEQELRAHR